MLRKFTLALTFLMPFFLSAQVLDEEVQVLEEPGGEALFELNKGLEIYSFMPEDDWYKVRRQVYVKPEMVEDSAWVAAGTELKDEDGKTIGKTLQRMEIVDGRYLEGFRKDEKFTAVLEGYLFKTKFERGSMPEDRLEEILAIRNRTEQDEAFEELFDDLDFEERKFGEFTVQVYRENHRTSAEEKDFRLIMIFKDETRPYAVLTKDHDTIHPEKIKSEWSRGPYRAVYFYKPREEQAQVIQDEILYTFLAL